jgi:predicted nucleic acid binding AN1-type Zn finger protein
MGLIDKIRSFFGGFFNRKEYPIHATCAVCGKNSYLPFHCDYCNLYFCDMHRLPFDHDCRNIAEWKKRPLPSSRQRK